MTIVPISIAWLRMIGTREQYVTNNVELQRITTVCALFEDLRLETEENQCQLVG